MMSSVIRRGQRDLVEHAKPVDDPAVDMIKKLQKIMNRGDGDKDL